MAAAASRVYVVSVTRQSISAIATLAQLLAAATVPLQCLRVDLNQTSSTTSTQQSTQANDYSVACSSMTSFTPVLEGPSTDPAASAVGGTSKTAVYNGSQSEGTVNTVKRQWVWNYLNGLLWLPGPKEPTFGNAGGNALGIKLPVAPGTATTFTLDWLFEELA
jgi:hypothetical protein